MGCKKFQKIDNVRVVSSVWLLWATDLKMKWGTGTMNNEETKTNVNEGGDNLMQKLFLITYVYNMIQQANRNSMQYEQVKGIDHVVSYIFLIFLFNPSFYMLK